MFGMKDSLHFNEAFRGLERVCRRRPRLKPIDEVGEFRAEATLSESLADYLPCVVPQRRSHGWIGQQSG